MYIIYILLDSIDLYIYTHTPYIKNKNTYVPWVCVVLPDPSVFTDQRAEKNVSRKNDELASIQRSFYTDRFLLNAARRRRRT